jgi:soluble lytic murein transglycosylase-like protein
MRRIIFTILVLFFLDSSFAGNQLEEQLSLDMQLALQAAISGSYSFGAEDPAANGWVSSALPKVANKIKDENRAKRLLHLIYYESVRAGLDPDLVLGVVTVESGFHQYAISDKGARGLMQVMPFWNKVVKQPSSLFDPQVNLRFGCSILRLYLIQEKGDLERSLKRYNGSLMLQNDSYVRAVETLYHSYSRKSI